MENEDWYYFDKEEWCYKLTDKAPKEAVDSYKEFYTEETGVDENGNVWVSD
jgi:hypothetical protein